MLCVHPLNEINTTSLLNVWTECYQIPSDSPVVLTLLPLKIVAMLIPSDSPTHMRSTVGQLLADTTGLPSVRDNDLFTSTERNECSFSAQCMDRVEPDSL